MAPEFISILAGTTGLIGLLALLAYGLSSEPSYRGCVEIEIA